MNNFKIASLLFFGVLFSAISFTSCDDDDDDTTPVIDLTLTDDERTDLTFMREEEKLARDVYLYLYEVYGMNIFNNISSSEQSHMDAILVEMNTYGIVDPASSEIGVFNNPDLQALYDALIIQGDISLLDAFIVGATIEDVDIRDLNEAIAATENEDLLNMYDKLNCGSRNHLRGFTDQIAAQSGTYTPQFISVEEYDDILSGSHENCGG